MFSQKVVRSGCTGLSGDATDSVRWCTGQCLVCQDQSRWTACSRVSTAAYGYKSPDCPVVHRTVRWVVCGEVAALGNQVNSVRLQFTGLSGEAPDCPVRQRSGAPTVCRAIRAWCVAEPTVGWGHRTVLRAPRGGVNRWSCKILNLKPQKLD
jgi:hypothetical protein